jgi:hypothetical protein
MSSVKDILLLERGTGVRFVTIAVWKMINLATESVLDLV